MHILVVTFAQEIVCESEECPDLWSPCRDLDLPPEMRIAQSDRESNSATKTRKVSSKDERF